MFLREHHIINLVLFQDHRYLSLQQQFDANQKLKLILEGACGIRAGQKNVPLQLKSGFSYKMLVKLMKCRCKITQILGQRIKPPGSPSYVG